MPNNLSQFWQELKRRKVVRVITVYAAASFVILELTDIVAPSLGLPDWTLNLIIILLCVGFVITVIVSWIYDIHPEEGVVKTKPAHKVKEGDTWDSSKNWRIASYISFVVIVGLIVLNVIPRRERYEELVILDKSIAVLPFINDNPEKKDDHIIRGSMESILNNLCKISDLRVISRSSVEQYRDTAVYIPDVAEKLKVSYVLEGSMQKYGNQIRLTLQLIDRNDMHIWSEQYDRDIREAEEYFDMYSDIAKLVAGEIEAIITPEEKQLIEKIPTLSLKAYNFYQRGIEEYEKYRLNPEMETLERAEDLYHTALEDDSTFALAYTGLAKVYYHKHYRAERFKENVVDSVLSLVDIALSYDDQLAQAYNIKGIVYQMNGNAIQAIEELSKSIKYNPNNFEAYRYKGSCYSNYDLLKSIDNYQKAASLNQGPELSRLFIYLAAAYKNAGFHEKAYYYLQDALKLNGDSARYNEELAEVEMSLGNYEKAIELGEKGYSINPNRISILSNLGRCYLILGQHEESLRYFKIWIERLKAAGGSFTSSRNHLIGYAYMQNGYKKEAEYYFNEQINYSSRLNELGRSGQELLTYYYLAEVYAFRGEKEKAFENLRIFNQRKTMPSWMVARIKNDPFFESIKHEEEFQQIIDDIEAKYQAEHERVRQWLEENDML